MDKAARLARINSLASVFKERHGHLIGQTIKVVEVGPRDGLQNEKKLLTLEEKVKLIN